MFAVRFEGQAEKIMRAKAKELGTTPPNAVRAMLGLPPSNQDNKQKKHGTRARYVIGACRCKKCTAANIAYMRAWRQKKGQS